MTGRWFSPGTLAVATDKTDRHDITRILLKVALNKITINPTHNENIIAGIYCDSNLKTEKKIMYKCILKATYIRKILPLLTSNNELLIENRTIAK